MVVAPPGAGGMGEVCRAKDTKLGREVAIKVLPEDVARDPERMARFDSSWSRERRWLSWFDELRRLVPTAVTR